MNIQRVSDVSSVFNGKTPAKSDHRECGHPVLKIRDVDSFGQFRGKFGSFVESNFANRHRGRWVKKSDILILNAAHSASHVASKIYLAEKDVEGALATGEWLLIRANTELISSEYLYFLLQSPGMKYKLKNEIKGGHLYPSDIGRLPLVLPSLEEQRRIVDILDRAASIRRLRRQAQETARQIVPALFNKVFGDPATNPMGWAVRPLGEVVAGFEGGRNLQADAESGADGVLRILKVSAVTSGSFRATEAKPAPPGYIPPAHHFVRDGDLLFSRANTAELVGATALVRNPPPTLLLPDKIWRILWRDPSQVTPKFLLAWFKQPGIRTAMSRLASGTSASMRNISQGRLSTVGVILPPLELQLRFATQSALLERLAMEQRTGQHIEHTLTVALQANLFNA